MNTRKSPLFALALAAISLAGVGAAGSAIAQSTADDTELLLTQIQTDKRAVVLKSMQLDDAQMAAFIPVYDAYQKDRKVLAEGTVNLLNSYAANYDSMTDDAAGKLLKDWMKLEEERHDLVKTYVKKLDKVLPKTKVLRFVQIENKLNTVLSLPAVRAVPLAQ
jgi:hypothetical protein